MQRKLSTIFAFKQINKNFNLNIVKKSSGSNPGLLYITVILSNWTYRGLEFKKKHPAPIGCNAEEDSPNLKVLQRYFHWSNRSHANKQSYIIKNWRERDPLGNVAAGYQIGPIETCNLKKQPPPTSC